MVVIDGKSVFYRGYYAMPDLTTSKGVPSGGVYGFTVLALNVIKKLKPDYVCVAWDKSQTNIRSRRLLYAQYKAKRQSAPASFYDQIPTLFKLLEAFNWPLYEFDDYEADDIMATLAEQARVAGLETFLVSSDLDMLQAIGENTKIFVLKKGMKNIIEFDEAEFKKKYKVDLEQFRDLKALMGDSSDNIPGVTGVGQVGATKLLLDYHDLENIYKHIDEIPPKLAQKLISCKDMAFLSRELVTLMTDAPVELDLKSMSIDNLDAVELQKNLRELEFYSLLQQIPKNMRAKDQDDLMPQANLDLKKPKVVRHDSLDELNQLNWQKPVFLHAYCQQRFGRGLVYLLASDDSKSLHIYKVNNQETKLQIKQASIYGYNTKQLVQILSDLGVQDIRVAHDLKVFAFLLNTSRRLQSLTSLAEDQLGYVGELDELELEEFLSKAAEIAAVIFKIRLLQENEVKKLPKLKKLIGDIEMPFIPVLARLERAGMALDLGALRKLKIRFQKEMDDLQKTIYDLAGEEFNLASPAQLSRILYDKLELSTAGIKRTKSGYSTDADSLAKLKNHYPIVSYLLQWRELAKLQSTYVEGLLERVEADGRVYSEMRLTGTATGRLSSANPNLQNIPIKTEIGSLVRQVFIAPPKYKLISADYSQFELRLIAVLAGDKDLIEAFEKGLDVHTLTASSVFEVEIEKVTKQQRYLAKTINFGILYGQGPHSLANLTGMSYTQAREFIEKYFNNRPLLKKYLDNIRDMAEKQGYIETLFGRRRLLPDVKSSNFQLRQAAMRQAVNMPVQGTEADLMKLAMIELDKKLDQSCRQIMQVHDSILVECPQDKVRSVSDLMRKTMENIYPKLGITLKVDVAVDSKWPIA